MSSSCENHYLSKPKYIYKYQVYITVQKNNTKLHNLSLVGELGQWTPKNWVKRRKINKNLRGRN